MKKNFLYAILAVGVMASCSKDSYVDTPSADSPSTSVDGSSDDDQVAILLSAAPATMKISVNSRSAGSVGADGETVSNQWGGQNLYMFAFPKDDAGKTDVSDGLVRPFFNRPAKATAGQNTSGITWGDDLGTAYFPRVGSFDFFGYHADDAFTANSIVKGSVTSEVGNVTETVYYSPFVINGSQDLMFAKAELSAAQKTALGGNVNKAYSASTARIKYTEGGIEKTVQPNMVFNHLLTRLVFVVKTGVNAGAKNVCVRSIKVKSKKTGKFVLVSNNFVNKTYSPLIWDADKDWCYMQERVTGIMQKLNKAHVETVLDDKTLYVKENGVYKYNDLSALVAAGKSELYTGKYHASPEGTVVGEALLVSPEESYELEVEVMQYYGSDDKLITPPAPGTPMQYPDDQRYYCYKGDKMTIKASSITGGTGKATKFEASKSYNIYLIVEGLTEVSLTAQLGAWDNNAGHVDINPED